MKLGHGILLTVGVLLLIGGSLALILQDNPRYVPGEASAMVERVYQWRSNSSDLYSDLYEEYLGQGIWEVKSSGSYNGEQAVFRVYETTDTAQIYNDVARTILNRRDELGQQGIPPAKQDQPQFSTYEVKNMVKAYVLHQTIYTHDYLNREIEHPIKSVSVSGVTYIGDSQWEGTCYASYSDQSRRLLHWLFYEKSRTVSISGLYSSSSSGGGLGPNPYR